MPPPRPQWRRPLAGSNVPPDVTRRCFGRSAWSAARRTIGRPRRSTPEPRRALGVGERLVAWSRAVARAQWEGGSPDRGQRWGFMRHAEEDVARLERAASREQALDVVTDDIPASMTRTVTRPERIAGERGTVAT